MDEYLRTIYEATLAALRRGISDEEIDKVINCARDTREEESHERWIDEGGNGRYR